MLPIIDPFIIMHFSHKAYVAFGIALGLLCSGAAVHLSCPQFFTSEHLVLLSESFTAD